MTATDMEEICAFCNGPVGVEPWGILSTNANICIGCMESHLCIYKSAYPDECSALLDRVRAADVSWFKERTRKAKRQRRAEQSFLARRLRDAD